MIGALSKLLKVSGPDHDQELAKLPFSSSCKLSSGQPGSRIHCVWGYGYDWTKTESEQPPIVYIIVSVSERTVKFLPRVTMPELSTDVPILERADQIPPV